MLKKVIIVALVLIVALVAVLPAAAHNAGPCNDTNEDGSFSGNEYAQHHIRPAAQDGALGHGGHIPGDHQGFSFCNPSG
jgi:hypothetical protein